MRRLLPALVVILGVSVYLGLALKSTKLAYATASDTVNFQARLQTAGGAIVPDGNYNIEFKLYNEATGDSSTQGTCSGDSHCLWVEDYTGVNTVTVKDGYLSVRLGSITSFPNTIDWSQQLYLTMNIGGTGSPIWDGEMNPRLPLTATPFAFDAEQANTAGTASSAGQLSTTNGNGTNTLSVQGPSSGAGGQDFVIQDQGASGTYYLLAENASGDVSVSGEASAATIKTDELDTASTATLDIGATSADGISLGNSSDNIATTINGTTIIKPTTGNDSTAAFQVQDAAGLTLIGVDSTSNIVNVGATGSTDLASIVNIATSADASQIVHIGDSSNETSTVTVGSLSGASTTSIQGGTGGLTLQTGTVSSGNSGSITIESGDDTGGTSGNVVIDTGASSAATGTNLEHNGFESTTEGWGAGYGYDSSSLGLSTTDPEEGGHSLTFTTNSNVWDINGTYPGPAVTPGGLYHFSVWIRGTSSGAIELGTTWVGGTSGGGSIDEITNATTGGWTELSGYATAPSGATNVWMYLAGDTASGDTVYVDNARIDGGSAAPFVAIGDTNAAAVIIGNTSAAGGTLIQGGADGVNVTTAAGNSINIGTNNDSVITLGDLTGSEPLTLEGNGIAQTITGDSGSGPSDIIETSINSTNALQVQNSSGLSILNVNTVDSSVELNNASLITPNGGFGTLQNLLGYSEQFNIANTASVNYWTPVTNMTISTNATTAPNGAYTADTLVGTGDSSIQQNTVDGVAAGNYTFSVWLKQLSGSSSTGLCIFSDATPSSCTSTVVHPSSVWQRFSVTQAITGSPSNLTVEILPGNGSTASVYAWGAQLVSGSSPGAYVSTQFNDVVQGYGTATGDLYASNGSFTGSIYISSPASAQAFVVANDTDSTAFQVDTANHMTDSYQSMLVQSTSSTAFQVQNTSSENLVAVDTSGDNVDLGATDSTAVSSTVNIATSANASQTVNIASGAISSGSDTVNIGTGATGSGDSLVTVGATSAGSHVSLLGGGTTESVSSSGVSIQGPDSSGSTDALALTNAAGSALAQFADNGVVGLGFGPTSTLGYTSVGSAGQAAGAGQDTIFAQKFTTTAGGTIQSMSAYIGGAGVEASPYDNYQFAIYSDSSGTPGNYIASSTMGTLSTAGAWYTRPITATLSPSTTYWLVYWQNDNVNNSNNGLAYDGGGISGASSAANTYTWQSGPDNGFPAAFPTSGMSTYNGYVASLYATFSSTTAAMFLGSNGSATFQANNSTTAFQIQDATSNDLVAVDTSGDNVDLGATGTVALSTAVNIATSTGATQTVHIADSSSETSNVTIGSLSGTSTTTVQGGTGATAVSIQAGTAGTISIGTTNANTLDIGSVGSTANATTLNLADTSGNATQTVNIGSNGATTSTVTIDAGTGSSAIQIGNSNTDHGIQIGTGSGVETITLGSTGSSSTTTLQAGTGGLSIATGAISGNTGAITIQSGDSSTGTSGNITIDNGSSAVVGGSNLESDNFDGSADGWISGYSTSTPAPTSAQAYSGPDSLSATTTTNNYGWAIEGDGGYPGVSVAAGQTYTLTLWIRGTMSESVALNAIWHGGTGGASTAASGTISTTGWTKFTGTVTVPAGATNLVPEVGGADTGSTIYIDDFLLSGTAAPIISIGGTNAAAIQIGNHSEAGTTTLQSGSGGINLDAVTGNVVIGSGSGGESTGQLLVLDSDTDSTYSSGSASNAPTEVDGAMFYSPTNGDFMCGVSGSWETCDGLLYSNTAASSANTSCTTSCAAFNTTVPIPANYCQPGRVIHVIASGIWTASSSTIAFGLYYGTDSTTASNDVQVGGTTQTSASGSPSGTGWTVDYTLICFSSTTVNGQGYATVATSSSATSLGQATPVNGATVSTTSAQNLYLFPTEGATSSSATLEQLIVTGN
ncbi:MAG TPA: hypothetical protein VMB52_00860 [Verrucomicrobiae bacterium]|nr:hypothetical protein [Verrucomicrobiae bacterium]